MSIGRRKHSPAFAHGGRTGEVLRQPGHQDRRRLLDVPGLRRPFSALFGMSCPGPWKWTRPRNMLLWAPESL